MTSSEVQLQDALEMILEDTGIVTPPHRHYLVREALRLVADGGGAPETYVTRLKQDKKRWLAMISALTVGETYLFRHYGHYEVLRDLAAQRRLQGRPCRVLCAGCATGEEAWSAAAVIADVFGPHAGRGRVVGWDIDHARIVEARRGRYRAWSVRHGLKRYTSLFEQHDDLVVAGDRLRPLVEFETINLAKTPLPDRGRFDAIFFRNVAIYWMAERTEEVLAELTRHLVDDGLLFVGPADPVRMGPGWIKRIDNDAILFALSRATPDDHTRPRLRPKNRVRALPAPSSSSPDTEPRPPTTVRVTSPRALAVATHLKEEQASRSPDDHDELVAQARALADREHYEQARALLGTISGPRPVPARLLEGIVFMNLKRPEEAVRLFRQCVFLAPHERAYRQWLAVAYETLGWTVEAHRERRNLAAVTDDDVANDAAAAAASHDDRRGECS